MKLKIFILISLISFNIFTQGHSHHDHSHSHGPHSHNHGGSITGYIIDSNNTAPRKYASISIVKIDNDDIIARGITNEFGIFEINEIPYGKYYIVVEYIGYEVYIVEDIKLHPKNLNIDIGTIKLIAKDLSSDVVSVVASPIIEDIEKTTYPVAETAREMGGGANEVLEQLPSISVDVDGNISLRGNSNVTILVDGRKSLMDVDMINANMIDKVEVMTTPSAKYDPDGIAGIINIVLAKNQYIGKTGSISLNQAIAQDRHDNIAGGPNLSFTFNRFQDDWNIFSSYSYNDRLWPKEGNRSIIYTEGDIVTSNIFLEDFSDKNKIRENLKLGVEHYFTDESLVAFYLTYIKHDNDNIDSIFTTDNLSNSITQTLTTEQNSGRSLNYGIGYFIDNKKENKSLSIQFDYDDHNDKELSYYTNDIGTILNQLDDNGFVKVFAIDYSAPIKNLYNDKSNYEVGMKIDIEDNQHYATIENEPFEWDANNNISSLYFNTAYYFTESFGMQLGARYEIQDKESEVNYTAIDCSALNQEECIEHSGFCSWEGDTCSDNIFSIAIDELAQGNNLNFTYDHNRVYPSLYFLYDLQDGKGNLKFELGRRINRPWHRATDPIPDISESESGFIHQGNPFLKPEDIYKSEISYSNRLPIGFLKAAIYYTKITDKLDRDKDTEIIDGEEYQILSWDNIGRAHEQGFDFTFMTRPTDNWDLMLNGNYWHNEYTEAAELDQLGIEYGFWGMMTSKISLKNDQKISLYAHYSTPMKITTGEISSFKRMDISYMKKVNDRFNFSLKLSDVFNTSGFHIITDQILENGVNEYLEYDCRRKPRNISFIFEYKFGEFNKKKYRRQGGHGHSHAGEGMESGY